MACPKGETPATIRICWPNPDQVCLQGGCGYCRDNPRKTRVAAVRQYAMRKHWLSDLEYGLSGNHAR